MSTLDDLLSHDSHRIWSGACRVRTLRDKEELAELAKNLKKIKAKTKGIDLRGALRPNSSHLDFALKKLKFVSDNSDCLCGLYLEDDMYNPVKEQEAGNIKIHSTNYMENGYIDYYSCECTLCSKTFNVEEREYHYTWWSWKYA